MFALFLCALILPSQAVPVKLSQQGRLLDSSGGVMTGNHLLAFRFYDNQMGGSIVWEEILSVNFIEGYYSVILGADSANPLEDSMLAQGPLYIEIEVDGNGPVGMRQPVVSTPYARLAGTSENIDGGTVNASQISISGNLIVDQSGNWVGPTITLDWANIQGIPSEITNGDSDTLLGLNCNSGEIATWSGSSWECTSDNTLTDAEVDALVINGPIDLDSNSTLGGIPILTEGSTGSLSGLSCLDGELAKWDALLVEWYCGNDEDSVLTEADVEQYVTNDPLNLAQGTTINGQHILTSETCESGEILSYDGSSWNCTTFQSLLDGDADGIMSWADCDDQDAQKGSTTNDADCDGVASEYDCNDNDASLFEMGTQSSCSGESCKQILDSGYSSGDGVYWLSSNGNSFQAYCDMTTEGGGWTLIFNLDTNDGSIRSYSDTDFWLSSSTYGNPASPFSADFKSDAYNSIPIESIMFQAHMEGSVCSDCASSSIKPNAVYTLSGIHQGLTMSEIQNIGADTQISSSCTSNGTVVDDNTYTRVAGDIFIDRCEDFGCITIDSSWDLNTDADNTVRFGSSCSTADNLSSCSSCYGNGHNVQGGLGGHHDRNGEYGLNYEYQPQMGYHPGPYGIGDDFVNTNGCGQSVWSNQCGPTDIRTQIDMAIFAR